MFERIKEFLPENVNYQILHFQTQFTECRPLVYKQFSKDSESILLFVLLQDDVPILGLEFYLYKVNTELVLFVSKADTSGFASPRFSTLLVVSSIINEVLTTYGLEKVKVCLFAKSMQEYLFLHSKENGKKHVLSDAELVTWWIKCLNRVPGSGPDDGISCGITCELVSGKLLIPGLDDLSTKRYFNDYTNWEVGTVFENGLALNVIPRFPDDPKTRFLTFLVRNKKISGTSSERFITELQLRQEFRLAKAVGIIGSAYMIRGESGGVQDPFTKAEVNVAKDLLLNIDFSEYDSAKRGGKLLLQFGEPILVTGEYVYTPIKKQDKEQPQVNNLTNIVRKKRKTK